MVVVIKKGMTWEEADQVMEQALQSTSQKKKQKKIQSLEKLRGLLSRLKQSPIEIQKELRDGWL